MRGLWTSPHTFREFADADRSALLQEVATREAAGGMGGLLGLLPDPDPVLRKRGEGVAVLRELEADDKVGSSIQSRKLGTLGRDDYELSPGKARGEEPTAEAEALCKALEQDLENLDLYNIISEILDAPYYGMAVVEILWEPADGRLRIADLRPRQVEWFGFGADGELLFKSQDAPQGQELPEHKFSVVRHFPSCHNPYGVRLLSRCLWPVAFKKGGLKFWLTAAERFGIPWVIGKIRSADKAQRDQAHSALLGMVQDAVAVLSGDMEVDVHETSGKGGDLTFAKLVERMDSSIAQVIMGQTLTADVGEGGSYAAAKTHAGVLEDFRRADERLVCAAFNDIAWHYARVNGGPEAFAPVFRYVEPQDYEAKAKLDKQLHDLDVRFTPEHFTSEYDMPEGHFYVVPRGNEGMDQAGRPAAAGGPAAFAAPDLDPDLARAEAAQELLEQWLTGEIAAGTDAARTMAKPLGSALARAESEEDARILLAEHLAMAEDDALAGRLHQALLAAAGYGWGASEQAAAAEFAAVTMPLTLPPAEALDYWRSKTAMTTEEAMRLSDGARSRAFAVSGLARQDLVAGIHQDLERALAEGQPFEAWAEAVEARLQDGEFLPRHRLATIFRTNTQTAYHAGRWAQLQQTKASRPYLRYVAIEDGRTRPAHRALHGHVAHMDDAFWDQFYPPNGFNCRCSVQSLSRGQLRERGLTPREGLPGRTEVVDPVTGEVTTVLPAPDPGFGSHAGKDWLAGLAPEAVDGEVAGVAARTLCRDGKGLFASSGTVCKPPLAGLADKHILPVTEADILPKDMAKEDHVRAFLSEFGLRGLDDSRIVTLPSTHQVVVSKWLFVDKATGEIKITWQDKGQWMRLLARTIRSPYEIWWDTVEVGEQKRLMFRLKLIRMFELPDKNLAGYSSFSLLDGRYWQGATAFAPRSGRSQEAIWANTEKERTGVLLYREPD
jgi:SPP1 gp7 family putative phage head morphogenesis protein